ncbi:hypothetical protein KCU71_g14018, partial [Aureobasidium melanogenum]
RAYAAYANDDLSSLVIINAQQVNASDADKGSIDFAISLPGLKGQTLYLSYLNADGADVTQNVTWNGLSFESDSVGTATTAQDQSGQTVVLDSNGAGTITVRDSQAVIANLGARLGSLPVDVANPKSSSGSGHSGSGSGQNGHTSSASTSGGTRTVSTSASTTAIAIASTTAANIQAVAASGSATSSSAGVSVTAKSASSKTIMLTDKTLFAVVFTALVCIFTS